MSFYMIEKRVELWLMLQIHIKNKINDSANVVLLCTVYDQVSDLFDFLLLGSENFLKLLVK